MSRRMILPIALSAIFALIGLDASAADNIGTVLIPQPSNELLEDLTRSRLAPDSQRVDLVAPTFAHPTEVTNPLFPISKLHSAVLIGQYEGKHWRAETTLLPETRTVEWNGQSIEVLQSQFVAYLGGQIYEVAVDLYAQADDGSVWYFGEDAFSYERGRVSDVKETWHAGVEGPATMIMPGHPKIGNVFRPENIPGLIFEQVTVKTIGDTRDGPVGPVHGVMVAEELHMEGDFEDKTFAPGYGELRSGLGENIEANAIAIPVDALQEPVPAELPRLSSEATQILEAVRVKDWGLATAGIEAFRIAYAEHQRRKPPKKIELAIADSIGALVTAMSAKDTLAASSASFDVALSVTDLTLRYRPQVEVDRIRLNLWARQLVVDAEAGETGEKSAVAGDVATLQWIRDRIVFDSADAKRIDDQLRYLVAAADAKDMQSAAKAAERFRVTLAAIVLK